MAMLFTKGNRMRMRTCLSVFVACLVLLIADGWTPVDLSGAEESDEATAHVVIRGRQFLPQRTVLHQGRKTRLVFQNQDSELHTFAPVKLFTRQSVTVAGNGAPEFGPDGLLRVIIPPDGRAEVSFTPANPGAYRYICDMPGHEMNAVIVIE
jgi:plastocyanin